MLVREIQQNETIKFRVPSQVAQQIRLIKSECNKLDWKFVLNDEISQFLEKQCRKALTEIETELDRRKRETSDDVDVEAITAPVRSQKPKSSSPNPKPLPIIVPGEELIIY